MCCTHRQSCTRSAPNTFVRAGDPAWDRLRISIHGNAGHPSSDQEESDSSNEHALGVFQRGGESAGCEMVENIRATSAEVSEQLAKDLRHTRKVKVF